MYDFLLEHDQLMSQGNINPQCATFYSGHVQSVPDPICCSDSLAFGQSSEAIQCALSKLSDGPRIEMIS